MPSLASSPITPPRVRPRNLSSDVNPFPSSVSSVSDASNATAAQRRRSSRTSQPSMPCSPTTPRQQLNRPQSGSLSTGGSSSLHYDGFRHTEGGLENLADELADAWGEDGLEEPGSSFLEGLREETVDSPSIQHAGYGVNDSDGEDVDAVRDSREAGSGLALSDLSRSPAQLSGNAGSSPFRRHKRRQSQYKDRRRSSNNPGTEEFDELSPSLERQMAEIEALARQGLDDESVGEGGGIIPRTTTALKDLGAQASIEHGVRRLATAYSSISSHRTAKTREISSLAHSVLMTRAFNLPESEIDQLLTAITQLTQDLRPIHPQPTGAGAPSPLPNPLQSLHTLATSTADLAHTLQSTSDLIQESRQTSATASRRLKAVRDFVVTEIKEEESSRQQGIHYLETGDWGRRICDRQAAGVCGDLVAGFESTCASWRDRLFGVDAGAAPA